MTDVQEYAAAEIHRKTALILEEAVKTGPVLIRCTSVEEVAKVTNAFNVQRYRHGAAHTHIRRDNEALTVEVMSRAERDRRRRHKREEKALVSHEKTWPGRGAHLARAAQGLTTAEPHEGVDISDYLMWVGSKHYPTRATFIEEGQKLGCSKRINRVPHGLRVGASRVFLVHSEGAPKGKKRKKDSPTGYIFGFFLVNHVDLIIEDEARVAEFYDALRKTPVRVVLADAARKEPERGCGHREVGAVYMVSSPDEDDWTRLCLIAEGMARKIDVEGGIAVLKKPIPYSDPLFRGICVFDAKRFGLDLKRPPALPIKEAARRATIKTQPKAKSIEKAKGPPKEEKRLAAQPPPVERPAKVKGARTGRVSTTKPNQANIPKSGEPAKANYEWRPSTEKRAGDMFYFCDADMRGFCVPSDVTPDVCPYCGQPDSFAKEGALAPYLQKERRRLHREKKEEV